MPEPASGPRSREIREDLRAKILDGTYRPGDKLPSIGELEVKYGAARHVARYALRRLADEGYARAESTDGYFVLDRAAKTAEEEVAELRDLVDTLAGRVEDLEVEVAELKRRMPAVDS